MNKYQEALDTLLCKAHTNHEECEANRCTKDKICLECDYGKAYDQLQELVEKATPKKVIGKQAFNVGFSDDFELTIDVCYCPTCNKGLYKFGECCYHCGQALDWSDEECQ